ncbi:MAG: NADH-ubiquinone oxidoreductase-F iron-sulfur binding region domain-containing protein [Candidatus Woesearchaeota archaeon]
MKCMFCGEKLEKGRLWHDTDICIQKRTEVKNFIENSDKITVGLATCGISAGAKDTLDELKKFVNDIPILDVGCSGMCFNEPVVVVQKNNVKQIYSKLTVDIVPRLIDAISNGRKLDEYYEGENLSEIDYYKKQKRIIMKRCGLITPTDIKHYISTGGFLGLVNALKVDPSDVIETVKLSGLRGRGGAGFLTGMKWQFLANNPEKMKYLVVNADEGDPGAFMNRTIMESDPYSILEGFIIAAYATGSKQGVIYTRAEYPLAIETLEKAIQILRKNNLLGKNILGMGFDFDVSIMKGAGAFVCGEETALMHSVEGARGHPTPRPPYPAEHGINGYPTNINNVESYAQVANIFSMGVDNYKQIGSNNNSGTKCICLAGKIKRSGVVEIPMGIPLKELIYDIGGGIKKDKQFKAVQSGGPSGGCITANELDTPLDFDNIPKVGAIMGSGGLVVMDEDDCMVSVAKFFLTFTAEESCGKCVPCREGTKRMLEIIDRISKGVAKKEDIYILRDLAAVIKDSSLCGLGQTAPNPVISTIDKFEQEYIMHIEKKHCPAKQCLNLIEFFITKDCVGCGNCARHCPVSCISGKPREVYLIDQLKCIKCGMCQKVCAFDSVIKR